jgi:hypothetical protein
MLKRMGRSVMIWLATKYLQRDSRLLPPSTSRYVRHRLEDAVVSGLGNSNGVFVHWGVYGSGKSVAVRHAAQRLQDEHGHIVLFRKGYDIWNLLDPMCDLYAGLRLPPGSLLEQLSTPTTLIVDHFDTFVWPALVRREVLMRGFRDLLACARANPRFNVLLVFHSWEVAQEVKALVDAKLVVHPGCGRWTSDELIVLKDAIGRDPAGCDEALRLAVASGSPSVLISRLMHLEPFKITEIRAEIYENEWTQGILALTGGTPLGPGRFPDREGRFHWEKPAPLGPGFQQPRGPMRPAEASE